MKLANSTTQNDSTVVKMIYVPDEANLLAISQVGQAQGLHLISNGKRSALCSVIPTGWHNVTAMQKQGGDAEKKINISLPNIYRDITIHAREAC